MVNLKEAILSDRPTKSIFASKTFWGAVLAGVSALTPIVVKDIKAHKLPIGDMGQAILILSGVGTAIVGRVAAKDPIHIPNRLAGPNKSELNGSRVLRGCDDADAQSVDPIHTLNGLASPNKSELNGSRVLRGCDNADAQLTTSNLQGLKKWSVMPHHRSAASLDGCGCAETHSVPPAGAEVAGLSLGKDPRDFQRGATQKSGVK